MTKAYPKGSPGEAAMKKLNEIKAAVAKTDATRSKATQRKPSRSK